MSYNVSCGVSHISITSDTKVALFPLLPTNLSNNLDVTFPISSSIYNDDIIHQYFTPFSLPIIGYYDEYGSIDNIIKDDNNQINDLLYLLNKNVSEYKIIINKLTKNKKL